MDIDLNALHLLRPYWLLLIVPGILLPLVWRNHHDLQRRLRGNIAPHLLAHLIIKTHEQQRVRPVHLLAALLIIGALAAAGSTWEQDRPAFVDNRAPLIFAFDLSPSMDATDLAPSRLEAAKHKVHNLIERRGGARTALLAYAGSAHLVLPPTDDPALLDTFVQALSTDLIAKPGKNVLAVISQARQLIDVEKTPATLVLITDGADNSQFDALPKALGDAPLQVLVLAAGSANGGIIRNADGQPRTDDNGRPQLGAFDKAGLEQLAKALDAPLGSLTLDDSDLDWIEGHAQQHFQAASDPDHQLAWKDAGYWLCWPLLLIAFFSVRKGWSLNWVAGLVLAVSLAPSPAQAGALADAFMTPDQQGRWAFDHGHYPAAAAHFNDPYWKGVAAYQAVDYDLALASFARLDTPQAYFYLGNIYTRRYKFDPAIAAYQQALKLQPDFPEAQANLALAIALQKDTDSAQQNAPDTKADAVKFDNTQDKGKSQTVQTQQAASDAQWLENLTTSPARFLKHKFALQDLATQGATP
ncbi:MAG: VWA domain-containing protein [Pseudomonas sp.]|nr:VWA domain-containing protein [Pseudomonas sp.]